MICKKKKETLKSPSPSWSRSVFSRLGFETRGRKERQARSLSQASFCSGSVFTRLGAKKQKQRKKETMELIRSYVTCSSERQREIKRDYHRWDRFQEREAVKFLKVKITTPFTCRIIEFAFSKRIRMPTTVKTYDGITDPEDHLKSFTTTARVERWVMPIWCHMFNSTLLWSAQFWFDELDHESIDNFEDLRKTFLAYFVANKKVHQGSGAPELMRISGFMHGITHPGMIKRLNDNIPKMVDEMISVTKAFIRGKRVAAGQSKNRGQPWKQQDFNKPRQE
ncbi:hypothetical protein Tco_1192214, partial [Tanacetum coccineum]